MIVECPRCQQEIDIGDANREDCYCGDCGAPLRDIDAVVAHNAKEIEKLKWQPKESD